MAHILSANTFELYRLKKGEHRNVSSGPMVQKSSYGEVIGEQEKIG